MTTTENADPQVVAEATASGSNNSNGSNNISKPPLSKKASSKKRVSISPKKPTGLSSPPTNRRRGGGGGRRSSSHFGNSAADNNSDIDHEEDDDIEFTLDGANDIEGTEKSTIAAAAAKTTTVTTNASSVKSNKPRRRRRSSARFLRLSNGGGVDDEDTTNTNNDDSNNGVEGGGNYTSSEHLGEIYRQAIRMNAENKINAGNSWGLQLIENMDKFLNVDVVNGEDDGEEDMENLTPRSQQQGGGSGGDGRDELRAARKMKSRDEKGRINFTKASCTLDASVKIYSYRVDDVHLSSYRVLANLNRTDNKKDDEVDDDGLLGEGGGEGGQKSSKRRAGPKGPTQTVETNKANINMSKLDSAYDIDPLFHKMSKAFDEGGAKGLLLGNLGVAQNGCHIVFDSKESEEEEDSSGDNEEEETDEDNEEKEDEQGGGGDDGDDNDDEKKMEEFGIDPEEAVVWKESEIDITSFAAKLESMLASYGVQTSASVPFVPQLASLREDYATLEKEGYAMDEKDNMTKKDGRKRLKLYDAPEEEEKEAERSIHVIATERSRASILGTSMLGMSFGLSMDMGDGEDDNGGGAIDFNAEDLGGEGEFAPDDGSFGGGEGEFAPDFGCDGGSNGGGFGDARSYNNTKTLLDALCDADAFYEGSDYAFFDVKKFEKATDGNLWAGSQHWKKGSGMGKKQAKKKEETKKVMFANDDEEEGPKKQRKKAVKKDRVFVDFNAEPNLDAIFQKKKSTKKTKKSPKDPFQMAKTEKDFLLPPDADVNITQLTRLFSRPNAVVRRTNDAENNKPIGKTVGFYDVEDNPLGFADNDDNDFGFGGGDGGDGGFNFAYDDDDDAGEPEMNDADYNTDNFDEVRKVEKIDINYAQVAKKVDVRRLKKDLWTELEEKTAWVAPEEFEKKKEDEADDDDDDMYEDPRPKEGEPQYVSFKETVEKLDTSQSQNGVTVSFYFICCLHLANEKGLKLDSDGLEDFMISLDDGSAPTFGNFGNGFTETASRLKSRSSNREKKVSSYVEEDGDEEEAVDENM